ncbi:MAG: acrylyl-CoA reductase [Clostridiales bacterium]|nr:acrylyl-CoA reductase [Clostridiales bacterium]
MTFKAFRVYVEDGIRRGVETMTEDQLPEGEVLIRVHYSSLNYKDALSSNGNKGVTRNYPHTPGIDAAGIVEDSQSPKWKKGDAVIVTGFDLGMNTHGGLSEYIRVPADWVIKCPEGLSLREAMCYGTAGFTAALSVDKIVSNLKPEDGKILVTGATGGVGSVAVAFLSKLGYTVLAATGKAEVAEYLKKLGAAEIVGREVIDDQSGKPMLKPLWAGAVDTVSGNTLTTAIKAAAYGGHVTCCGNVSAGDFQSSVYPFILRGVTLHGIDSVQCGMPIRERLWALMATDWKVPTIFEEAQEITLDEVESVVESLLAGKHKGRTIVKLP